MKAILSLCLTFTFFVAHAAEHEHKKEKAQSFNSSELKDLKSQYNTVLIVDNMVCESCSAKIEETFSKKEEVNSVKVDLSKHAVSIEFKEGESLSLEKIKKDLEYLGYPVKDVIF